MPDLLERDSLNELHVEVDERLARVELRRQVGRLERELAGLFAEAFGRVEIDHRVAAPGGEPRVLGLGELERLRDALADRVAEARLTLAERARVEAGNRELLRQMLAAPADYKWVQVSRADLGEPGCGALALASPPRADRDADGLVAGQGLLGMPVSRAACGR